MVTNRKSAKPPKKPTNRLSAADKKALEEDTAIDLEGQPDGKDDTEIALAKQLLAQRQEREKKCGEAIKAALAKYDCVMDVSVNVTSRGNFPQTIIMAREKQEKPNG